MNLDRPAESAIYARSGDFATLPRRLTASEVCKLARYSRGTLYRRVKDGKMPGPVDRGAELLFDADAVRRALGIADEPAQAERNPWDEALDE